MSLQMKKCPSDRLPLKWLWELRRLDVDLGIGAPPTLTPQLPHTADRTSRALSVRINPLFEDCFRYIASHSQPLETLNVPTLDMLKAAWKKLQDARDAYGKKN
jgi:hypothetical protein